MRTLVINLTRFGDLIQTQPVLSELAAAGEVGLVCLDNFSEAAGLLSGLSFKRGVPGAALLAGLDRAWPEALAGFCAFSRELSQGQGFDKVVNLTSSLPARLLASHLNPREILGFGLDAYGFSHNSSPWAAFLEASSLCRGASPFNLVDLFRRAAHLAPGPCDFELARPQADKVEEYSKSILQSAPAGSAGYVCFQLGASADIRRWPTASFAALGDLLQSEFKLFPVLLGSPSETALAERYASAAKTPHLNLIGRTGLSGLAEVLCGARLLVTNDTGTMHLAAGLGVPIAAVFLATAQPFDTGPYCPGSLCLEADLDCHPCSFGAGCPHNLACRQAVSPEEMFEYLGSYLRHGAYRPLAGQGRARAWLSQSWPDGMMGLRSLSGHENSDRFKWIALQRSLYGQFLDAKAEIAPLWPGGLSPDFASELRQSVEQARALLELLSGQGELLARTGKDFLKPKFMATWQKLYNLLAASPKLKVLAQLWLYQSQEVGEDFPRFLDLARAYAGLFAALSQALV